MNQWLHSDDYTTERYHRKAISVEQAQQLVMQRVIPGASEQVHLTEAAGRFLTESIYAPHPFPNFRRSGMDGYAIVSSDTAACGGSEGQDVWLQVIDEVACGFVSEKVVQSGTAVRIMTGAQVPDGADAVVMLEATRLKEEAGQVYVGLKKRIQPGANVTEIGYELKEGELLLQKGTQLGPGEISVLATFGVGMVTVYRRPRVGIFSTGSELLQLDEPLQPGRIRNSNTYMLAVQIRNAGGIPCLLESITDDVELARERLQEALEQVDMVVTSGGVSVGDYDIMGELVRQEGVELLFNKITMRPGSVTTTAVIDNKLLFALSGNPGACFVGCELLVRPFIRGMQGAEAPYLAEWTAYMGADYRRMNNYTRFVRATLSFRDGQVIATPARIDESSVMISIKDSDCLIVIPPGTPEVLEGERIQILKLEKASI